MLLDNARKHRLMREALGNDEGRLPSAASSLRTLGVVVCCLAVIGISATGLRETPHMVANNDHAAPAREVPVHPLTNAAHEAPVNAVAADAKQAPLPAASAVKSF